MVNVELAIYIEIYLRESLTIIQEREREKEKSLHPTKEEEEDEHNTEQYENTICTYE